MITGDQLAKMQKSCFDGRRQCAIGGTKRSNLEEHLKLFDMAIKSKVDEIIVQALNEDLPQ